MLFFYVIYYILTYIAKLFCHKATDVGRVYKERMENDYKREWL